MTRDIEGGKKKIITFQNVLDGYRRHAVLLNMMSDYNTSTTAPKQLDPIISWTRLPLSYPMQKSMLYSQERDMSSKLAQMERALERQGIVSGSPRESFDNKVELEKERLRQVQ
jgi:hypothetical protein